MSGECGEHVIVWRHGGKEWGWLGSTPHSFLCVGYVAPVGVLLVCVLLASCIFTVFTSPNVVVVFVSLATQHSHAFGCTN